jgi:hypothetical protein
MSEVVEMKKGKKVGLNVLERFGLLGILPREGTFLNLKLLRVIREELSFTETENETLQFRQEGQMMSWNSIALMNKATGEIVKAPNEVLMQMVAKDPDAFDVAKACPDKEFVFGETVEGLIIKALKDIDKAGKITEEQYSLYEKFMEGHEN